ncbi:MAG TPA: hypothetical protein VIM29_02680, partial [Bacillota bacterium]
SDFKTTISFDVYPNNTAIQTATFGTSVSFLASAGTVKIPVSVSIPAILKTANVSIDNPGDFSTTAGTGVEVRDLVVQNTGNITLTFSGVRVAIDDGNWVVDTHTPGYTFNPPGGFSFNVYFYPNGPVDYSQSIIFTFSFNYPTNYGNVLSGVFYKSVSFHAVATGTAPSGQVGITVSNWNVDSPNIVVVGKYVTGSFGITASSTNNQIANITISSPSPYIFFTTVSGVGINTKHSTAVNPLHITLAPGVSVSVYTQWQMDMTMTSSAPNVTFSVTGSNLTQINGVSVTEKKLSTSLNYPPIYNNLRIGKWTINGFTTISYLNIGDSFQDGDNIVVRNNTYSFYRYRDVNAVTGPSIDQFDIILTMSITTSNPIFGNIDIASAVSTVSECPNSMSIVYSFNDGLASYPEPKYYMSINAFWRDGIIVGSESDCVGNVLISWQVRYLSHINDQLLRNTTGYAGSASITFNHYVYITPKGFM